METTVQDIASNAYVLLGVFSFVAGFVMGRK